MHGLSRFVGRLCRVLPFVLGLTFSAHASPVPPFKSSRPVSVQVDSKSQSLPAGRVVMGRGAVSTKKFGKPSCVGSRTCVGSSAAKGATSASMVHDPVKFATGKSR